MKTLSEFLVEEFECDLTDLDDTFDTVEWKGVTVCEDEYDEHRWYTNYRVVKKFVIDNVERYFEYYDCNTKGDGSSKSDCGWEKPHPDDMREVFPKEVITTIYN